MYRGPILLNEAGAGDGNQEAAKAEAEAKAKAEAEAKSADEAKQAEEAKKKGGETEGRISELVKEKKELEKKLKEIEDGKKKAAEDELKKKGELQTLLDSKEKELANLSGLTEQQKATLETYESIAKEQVEKALEAIKDEERRKDAQQLLEGRSVAEQFKLIPTVMKLAGVEQKAGFGNSTPSGTQSPGQSDVATKKARYSELLGKGSLSPQERVEMNRLMNELSDVFTKEQAEKAKS